MKKNLTPYIEYFAESTTACLVTMVQGNILALGLIFTPILANVVKVPMTYLVPSVLSMAVFGAFGLTGDLSRPIADLIFSVIGWLFKRLDYSVPAAVIGILLGGKLLGVLTGRAKS